MSVLMLQWLPSWITENTDVWVTIFIGAVAGLLAQLIVPGRGFNCIVSILLGVAGGWLGGKLFKNTLNVTSYPMVNAILCATAGAIILYAIISVIALARPMKVDRFGETKKRSRDKEW